MWCFESFFQLISRALRYEVWERREWVKWSMASNTSRLRRECHVQKGETRLMFYLCFKFALCMLLCLKEKRGEERLKWAMARRGNDVVDLALLQCYGAKKKLSLESAKWPTVEMEWAYEGKVTKNNDVSPLLMCFLRVYCFSIVTLLSRRCYEINRYKKTRTNESFQRVKGMAGKKKMVLWPCLDAFP